MSSSGGSPNAGASWRGLWPVAAVVAIASVLAFFLIPDRKGPPAGGSRKVVRGGMSDEECELLSARLNEAVGNLEAGQLQNAEGALAELAQKLPDQPAAVRNLAICRVLAFVEPRLPGEGELPLAPVQSALDAARKLEPASPVPHILAARVAAQQQDAQAAVTELEAAATLAPDNPAIQYEIFDVGRSSNDERLRQRSRDAIAAALKSAPTNSYLLKEELVALAAEKDKRSVATV
jgi:predicted Zn-dependent protease